MDKDYLPTDHGTQTNQKGDKYYDELLTDSEKYQPTGEIIDSEIY